MTEEQQIKKGFNAGYLIAVHRSDLAEKIRSGFIDREGPFAKGFIAGVKEYEHEKLKKTLTRNYPAGRLAKGSRSRTRDKGKGSRDR